MRNLTKALKVLQTIIPTFFLMLIVSHLDWFPLLYALWSSHILPLVVDVIVVLGLATFLRFMIYSAVSYMLLSGSVFWNHFKALSLLNATILASPTVAIHMMMTYAIYGSIRPSFLDMIDGVVQGLLGEYPKTHTPGSLALFMLTIFIAQLIIIEVPKLLLYLYIAKRYVVSKT